MGRPNTINSPALRTASWNQGAIVLLEELKKQSDRAATNTEKNETDEFNITLTDLFDIKQLQKIQNTFSKATKVASIITDPNGRPVTAPFGFCRLCKDVIRKTKKGRKNCMYSDSVIGKQNPDGPIIQTCLSGGIWDAGASINVGGRHIGNFLMGQVKNELIAEDQILNYAVEIGADRQQFAEALQDVQTMSLDAFRDVSNLGFVLANELSNQAHQILQRKRQIATQHKIEVALERSSERLQLLLDLNNAITSNLDLSALVKLIPARVREVLQCDSACLAMPDNDKAHFFIRGLDFPSSRGFLREGMVLEIIGSGGVEDAYSNGTSLRCGCEDKDRNPDVQRILIGEDFRSECLIPVKRGTSTLAILHLSDRRSDRFGKSDMEFLTQIAGQIAIALTNAMKYQRLSDDQQRLASENTYLSQEIQTDDRFKEIVGNTPELKRVLAHVSSVAETDITVMINSETGTGKELIARNIHNLSTRRERMFVKLNCAAIPVGLLESELFGHEKGAFTGAHERKIGRFELANGGTLFLDEIGDFPIELQPKLLRVLQEQEFERVGSTKPIKINVRIISASNRDLEQMMHEGQFRADLYYRLNVFPIEIPPLRHRRDDIPLLIKYFVHKFAHKMNRRINSIPTPVMTELTNYDWPGNVRELQNLIQRAVILSQDGALASPFSDLRFTPERNIVLPSPSSASPHHNTPPEEIQLSGEHHSSLENVERDYILKILRETGGVVGGPNGAAARLGIPRTTLIYKLKRLHISPTTVAAE